MREIFVIVKYRETVLVSLPQLVRQHIIYAGIGFKPQSQKKNLKKKARDKYL